MPRQRLNYHLRELETEGLVELVEERRKGNCIERVLRSAAQAFVISPEALGPMGLQQLPHRDRFSAAYLVAAAVRIVREVAGLCQRANATGKRLATLTIETEVRFRTPEARGAFSEELAMAIAGLAAKYHCEQAEGRTFRFVIGAYPAIARPDGAAAADEPAMPVNLV